MSQNRATNGTVVNFFPKSKSICRDAKSQEGNRVSDYKRIALFGSGLLAGIAAFVVMAGRRSSESAERNAGRRRRQREEPPVEELAEELQQAWEGRHTP